MNDVTLRLFFALWPEEDIRSALTQAAASLQTAWGGRRMHRESLHLTLAFLGNTPRTRLDELRACAATVTHPAFRLTLNRPGCWPQNRVGWLGVAPTPPALTHLVSDLSAVLQGSEFSCDPRPYVPHVTLLRDAHCGLLPPAQTVEWRVEQFVLLASPPPGTSRGYDVLGAWPLAAGKGPHE